MRLNTIQGAPGSKQSRHRVGRGIGSGWGKTAGRGHKGQKSRSGGFHKVGFEGGQMPLHRRLPKRGFTPPNALELAEVNLGRIQTAIDAGKLDASQPVNAEALIASGVLTRARDGVKLLGSGELKAKLQIEVFHASKSAVAAVEKAGGSVKTTRSEAAAASA